MTKKRKEKVAADKPTRRKKKTAVGAAPEPPVQTIGDFSRTNMLNYALAVNLERSVPDIYDGLKPVQRRVLYGAYQQKRGEYVKSARIVGDIIGKYHPHGDSAVYGTMVNMAHSEVPYIDGKGNWGSLVDPPAAHRYTNARLTDYGLSFFNKDYFNKAVTDFVPNYDDKDIEPVTLPAMLPNVLINSSTGIGWGVTTGIPSFTPKSIIKVIQRLLKKEALGPEDFAKTLVLSLKNGGRVVNSKDNKEQFLKMFEDSNSRIRYEADLKVDEDKRTVYIDNWPGDLTPDKLRAKVLKLPETGSFICTQGVLGYTITAAKGYNLDQFRKYVDKVQKATQVSVSYKVNVTMRQAHINDGVVTYDTSFLRLSVAELLFQWLKMRLNLEKESLKYRLEEQRAAVTYSALLIYATSILDIIFKGLRQEDSAGYISKHSKLSVEEANQILELRVRQLSKLDATVLKAKLKTQKEHLKQLKSWLKRPRAKLIEDFTAIAASLPKT